MKKNSFFISLLIVPLAVALYAMPPHPDVVDSYREKGELKSLISRLESVSRITGMNQPLKSFPSSGTMRVPVLLVNFADPYVEASGVFGIRGFTGDEISKAMLSLFLFLSLLILYAAMSGRSGLAGMRPVFPVLFTVILFGLSCGVKTNDEQPDTFPTDPSVYSGILNGDSLSVKKFYQDMSQNKLNLQFDIYGPVTVSEAWDYYGENDGSGNDLHPAELVSEALRLLVSRYSSVDFGVYDNDGDTMIDAVIIIHQGPGEEVKTSVPSLIWSHQWDLSSAGLSNVNTGDGVSFNVYTMQPEYTYTPGDSSMGVFAHEFGHVLGLPDLYDTGYETRGVGIWSLMGGGAWMGPGGSGDGTTPAPLLAWERLKLGGTGTDKWITITDLSGTLPVNDRVIQNIESSREVFKVVLDESITGKEQYLLLEGKSMSTSSQWYVAADGILITHIHNGVIAAFSGTNEVAAGAARVHGVNIIEADSGSDLWNTSGGNSGTASDLFTAGSSITDAIKYTDYTNYTLASSPTTIDINDIKMDNPVAGSMTFDVIP